MSDSEDNSVHNVSEDSDDISDTEKIIREKIKVFKNEKDAVRIFLADHFRKFRFDFFSKIKVTNRSMFQAIKKEIRNCLNPYRIFIKEKLEIEKELKALYEELKRYYKEKNFNNTFFINYFKDLKNAHRKESKSKFINMLPKNEEEVLNDIQRKVLLIKSLKKYLISTIVNRLQQINFEKNQESENNKDEFIMIYQYLVIKREVFSNMNEEDFYATISNKKDSLKYRRPINDFYNYNYIPILCKGKCKQEADFFIQFFEKEIYQNHKFCKECEFLKKDFNNVKSQIRSLYLKTCIFSHNINEIMFHPLFFLSFENIPFYITEFKKEKIFSRKENLIETSRIPEKYININTYKIRKLYNEHENTMKEIIKLLKDYSNKSNLFGGSCFLPDYKTKECPLGLFKPSKEDWKNHLIKCPCYHSVLEKRRVIKIRKNKICKNALNNKEWITDAEKMNCENKDNCLKFHTRNELFYDERNFRKLYPCAEYIKIDENGEQKFCKKFEMCPWKHPVDIKIDEIHLPEDYKNDLKRDLSKLKGKNSKVEERVNKIKKIECRCCLNYIDGEDGRDFIFFITCNHIICSKCFKNFNCCPLCDLKSNEQHILIKLEKNEDNEENNSNESDEEEEEEDEDEEEEEEEDDKDVTDPDLDNKDIFEINSNNNLYESFSSKKYNVNNTMKKDNNESNEIEREENDDDKEEESSSSYTSSSYSNNTSNIRGRGQFRGRGGYERGRGRRVIRGRGYRGRGRGY